MSLPNSYALMMKSFSKAELALKVCHENNTVV